MCLLEKLEHMNVLCLHQHFNFILAGIGGYLYIYQSEKLESKYKVLESDTIHNISTSGSIIIVQGGKCLSIVKLSYYNQVNCEVAATLKCADWIQDSLLLCKEFSVILVTAHNVIQQWDLQSMQCRKRSTCREKCILYSCKILGNHFEDMIILAGTMFGDVIIWSPTHSDNDQAVLHRLKGHTGVIFSIAVDSDQKKICSTSDDRSIRVWSVVTKHNNNPITKKEEWQNANISLVHTLFGHTARVWKSLILHDCYISIGEDSKLCIWSQDGKLEACHQLHQGSSIRGLCYSKDQKVVLTGGEDGGIVSLAQFTPTSRYLACTLPLRKYKYPENNHPVRVAFLDSTIICSTSQGCVFKGEPHEMCLNMTLSNDDFSNYCLLDVSPCGKFVALASLHGRLLIFEPELPLLRFNKVLVKGKIFSLHWLNGFIVTCAANGLIELWRVSTFWKIEISKKKDLVLPESKERWTTCALICSDALIIGDRMGSVYVFSLEGDVRTPVQTFKRVHGCLGVTDLVFHDEFVFTAGRDGTVKEYALNSGRLESLLTHKMPMEWVWKIVIFDNKTLVLGFSSVFFVVSDFKTREVLWKYDCGGGHRSCDLFFVRNVLNFAYIKDKVIHFVSTQLDARKTLRSGFHSKEINCLRILSQNPLIFVSGSEDTTLRISRIDDREIQLLQILDNHISSIRTVSVCHVTPKRKMVISGGGRAQLSVSEFDLDTFKCKHLTTEKLKKECRNWKSVDLSEDPENRFMCLDSVKLDDGRVFIVSGCSDRHIRLFFFDADLILFKSIPYTHCILNVLCLQVKYFYLIVTMATDGRVVFWDVTNVISSSIDVELTPLKSITVHQSGINSFDVSHLGSNLFLFATGGDDNLLSVMLLQILEDSEITIKIISEWKNSKTHSCQITGIKFVDDIMMTTSIDQRVTKWRWFVKDDQVHLEFVDQFMSCVPDIQGMAAFRSEASALSVCLYGKGFQMIDVSLDAAAGEHYHWRNSEWKISVSR